MFTFWFLYDSILYQKLNFSDLTKKYRFLKKLGTIRVLTYRLKTHMLPRIPIGGVYGAKKVKS